MSARSNDATTLPVSVVIATLGGDMLRHTVARLNAGAHPPAEVLICIPEKEAPRASELSNGNVRVVPTAFRGQVAQRAEGFRQATQPFVMQLDDDMELEQTDIALLLGHLQRLGPGNAVAPVFVDEASEQGMHRQHGGALGFMQSANATLIGGLPWGVGRMGRISKAGTNFGVDRAAMTSDLMETEWLPGGCVLHFREGVVTDHFFPYPGKAYCEDLIHSHLLTGRGVRLWVARDATCKTGNYILPVDPRSILNEARARIYFNRLRGKLSWRFWVWIGVSVAWREIVLLSRRSRSMG